MHVQDTILFTAVTDAISAGTNPKYHWFVNGKEITDSTLLTFGKDTTTFLSNGGLHDSDVVSVILINTTYKCVTSDSARDSLQMFTFNTPQPTANITPLDDLCALNAPASHLFTVYNITNGGTHPSYQWYEGTSLPLQLVSQNDTYFDKQIIANDSILLIFTSSVACATPKDIPDALKIIIANPSTPTLTIAPDKTIVCAGDNITFTLTPTNGGTNPNYTFYQLLNGNLNQLNVNPIDATHYQTNSINDGGQVYCVMNSSLTCVTSKTANSDTTVAIKVNPLPPVNPITGDGFLCLGAFKTYSETSSGGTWSSEDNTYLTATLQGSTNGMDTIRITGIAITPNPVNIVYTITNPNSGCQGKTFLPTAVTTTTVAFDSLVHKNICPNSTDTIYNPSTQGRWYSPNTSVATVVAGVDGNGIPVGVVTSFGNGQVILQDTISDPICGTTIRYDTLVVGPPIIDSITGSKTICTIGDTTQLTAYVRGDTAISWSSSNTNFITVDANGLVTAVAQGTASIIVTAYNPCTGANPTVTMSYPITVGPPTDAGNINGGISILCVGSKNSKSPYVDNVPGGVWRSKDSTIVSIIDSINGIDSGVGVGVDSILYTVSNKCGSIYTGQVVTVASAPTKFPITANDSVVCTSSGNNTLQLSNAITGGVWGSQNTGLATIDQSGLVTGLTNGLDKISYKVTQSCGTYTIDTVLIVGEPIVGDYSFRK